MLQCSIHTGLAHAPCILQNMHTEAAWTDEAFNRTRQSFSSHFSRCVCAIQLCVPASQIRQYCKHALLYWSWAVNSHFPAGKSHIYVSVVRWLRADNCSGDENPYLYSQQNNYIAQVKLSSSIEIAQEAASFLKPGCTTLWTEFASKNQC